MSMSITSSVGGWSKSPLWRVLRWLFILTGLLSIPRLWQQGQPLSSWDVYETVAWLWNGAGEVYRWFGTQTGWY